MQRIFLGAVSAFALTAGAAFAEPDTNVQMFDGAQIAPGLMVDLANFNEPMFPGAETGDAEATTYVTVDTNGLHGTLHEPTFAMTDGGVLDVIDIEIEMVYVATTPTPAPMIVDDATRVLAYGPEAEFDDLVGDLMQIVSADPLAVGAVEYGAVVQASFVPGAASAATMGIMAAGSAQVDV